MSWEKKTGWWSGDGVKFCPYCGSDNVRKIQRRDEGYDENDLRRCFSCRSNFALDGSIVQIDREHDEEMGY
jgi:hypothetical protein